MTWLRVLVSRLMALFRKGRLEQELDEELRSHLEMQVEENVRKGMSPQEALYAALRSFGGVEQVKEIYRERRGLAMIETLLQDIRYALRQLRRSPGFAATAVLVIALGIGANTTMFSVVNSVMLRPLPYAEPERLVGIWGTHLRRGGQSFLSPASFLDCKNQSQVLEQTEGLEYGNGTTLNLITGSGPVRLRGARASTGLFSLLGVQALIGRTFLREDDEGGSTPVAVLTYGLWQERFQSDPQVIGKPVTLNGTVHTVIGVVAPTLQYPLNGPEVWVPLAMSAKERQARHTSNFQVFARLKPGVSHAQAQAHLSAMARSQEQLYPQYSSWGAKVIPLDEQMVSGVREGLLILLGAVGLVLLIACANIGNLLLARATVRRKEIAMRTALGASRTRLIRQLLTESLTLASLGGTAGLVLAHWSLKALLLVIPAGVLDRSRGELMIDGQVLAFTLAASLIAALIFGLAPTLRLSKLDLNASLKVAGRSAMGGVRDRRLRNRLVAAEVAISVLLLIGAGLLILSFWRLQNVNPGFRTEKLLTFRVSLPRSKYKVSEIWEGDTLVFKGQPVTAFYDELLERLGALSGVISAAASGYAPLTGEDNSSAFVIDGRPPLPKGEVQWAWFRPISPNYFRTLGVPLLRGRQLTTQDTHDAPPVAVINEAMARQFWASENPIGERFRTSPAFPWRTIVGIVGDMKHQGFAARSRPEMYFHYQQPLWPQHEMTIVLRTAVDPTSLAASARREVLAIDPDQPIYNVRTMEELVYNSLTEPRFNMLLLGIFASVALILAAVGIYGVMAYSMTQRTHELGLRMALGAEARDVIKLVLQEATTLASIGVAAGLAAALVVTRVLSTLLFGVRPTDPAIFVAVSALVVGVALLASYIPARQATKADPMVALRCE